MRNGKLVVGALVVALWCVLGGGVGFAAEGHGGGGFGGGFSGGHGGFRGGERGEPAPGGGRGFGGSGHFDGSGRGDLGHQDFTRNHFPDRRDFHFQRRRPEIFLYPYNPDYPGSLDDPYCDGDLRYYRPRYCNEMPRE